MGGYRLDIASRIDGSADKSRSFFHVRILNAAPLPRNRPIRSLDDLSGSKALISNETPRAFASPLGSREDAGLRVDVLSGDRRMGRHVLLNSLRHFSAPTAKAPLLEPHPF